MPARVSKPMLRPPPPTPRMVIELKPAFTNWKFGASCCKSNRVRPRSFSMVSRSTTDIAIGTSSSAWLRFCAVTTTSSRRLALSVRARLLRDRDWRQQRRDQQRQCARLRLALVAIIHNVPPQGDFRKINTLPEPHPPPADSRHGLL